MHKLYFFGFEFNFINLYNKRVVKTGEYLTFIKSKISFFKILVYSTKDFAYD